MTSPRSSPSCGNAWTRPVIRTRAWGRTPTTTPAAPSAAPGPRVGRAGASHVQACVNGYGERTGNADLITMLADLQLKMGMALVPAETLAETTRIAQAIGEIVNMPVNPRAPYVGDSAFAHKAGLHASAIRVDPDLYQHTDPRLLGNDMRMIISDMAGRASMELKGRELGFDLTGEKNLLARLAATVKQREAVGYSYEAADASFELL